MDSIFKTLYRKKTINRISKKCKLLGGIYNPINFMNLRAITCFITFIFFLIFSDKGYIVAPFLSILIYYLFEYYLDYKIKRRSNKLNYEAIFYFQVLALTLESGKDLKGAIKLTSRNIDSEISKEFMKCVKEMDMGKSLTESLISMKDRIPSEEINTVILNIKESSKFGNNIIDSLNNQIDYLRDKKILNIRATINKMPIKISVISVLFIIPIILLIMLGPVLINFISR